MCGKHNRDLTDEGYRKCKSDTKYFEGSIRPKNIMLDWIRVVEIGPDQTGGLTTLCIKIGYSSREPRRVVLPCIKIGYVSSMY